MIRTLRAFAFVFLFVPASDARAQSAIAGKQVFDFKLQNGLLSNNALLGLTGVARSNAGIVSVRPESSFDSRHSNAVPTGTSQALNAGGSVTIVRDLYRTAHVFAATDAGAYFGAGYAAAEDRLFQMCWSRLMYQGRIAEYFGPGTHGSAVDRNIIHDIDARLVGWSRHAQLAAAALDQETRALLDAYAEGVNAYLQTPAAMSHPFFGSHGVALEPWTAADCIGVWLRFGRHFGPNASDEAKRLHEWQDLLADGALTEEERLLAFLGPDVPNDAAAVVQRSDVPTKQQRALFEYAANHGLDGRSGPVAPPDREFHFSDAWAVSGTRTTNGLAMLVGDPRIELTLPEELYEWSMQGKTFSVRGAGVPGSPNILSGSTSALAWSPTASGLDQADLFSLRTDPTTNPGQYMLDGQWRDFTDVHTEWVKVAGASAIPIGTRTSVFGPVITAFVPDAGPGEEYCLRRVPLDDPTSDSSTAFVELYRSADVHEAFAAVADWRFPSANLVMADSGGHIAYALVGAIPVRDPTQPLAGIIAQDGTKSSCAWVESLPHALRPHVFDPAGGYLASANQRPVGAWYPIPILVGTNAAGDTFRSRRLHELLSGTGLLSPEAVAAPRTDAVHPGRRDIATLALWLRDHDAGGDLGPRALAAAELLEPWLLLGARLDGQSPGAVLASQISLIFRTPTAGEPLVLQYGAGEGGLNLMLQRLLLGTAETPPRVPGKSAQAWLDLVLGEALDAMTAHGPPATWPDWYQSHELNVHLHRWQSLEKLPPLGPLTPVSVGELKTVDSQTLFAPKGMVFSQWVILDGSDNAWSILPMGVSELQEMHHMEQMELWKRGSLKPSPRSREGVERFGWHDALILPAPGS